MKSLFIILLAGYAVRSNENNYYVIEMQDVPTPQGEAKKPFSVYWNVPTAQCASKKIFFDDLYENFGIIQNDNDRFKGEKVTILYDPGLFPALFKNESGGKIRFRNGGVPQEGNLNKHLDEFRKEMDRSIADKKFNGIGIIDFESWRPQFRQNFGELEPYKDVSYEIERKRHWWWKESWIKDEAKRRFEEAARTYMQSTLTAAQQLRPLARWGFYGFPYCFNMAKNNPQERCSSGVPEENDQIPWLWSQSTALYPSVYSSANLSTAQLQALIRGRVAEAARCAGRDADVILPYFWFRYRDAGFLTKTDLSAALSTLYKSAATGILIWGSSNDVNTVEKCTNLKSYVQNILGPAIAKYTKGIMRDTEENEDTTLGTDTHPENATPNLNSNVDFILDPEMHWIPPKNYTQAIKNDVEEQINNKFGQTDTNNDNNSVLQNNSVLVDLILNTVLNSVDNVTTTTDNPKNKDDKITQLQMEFVDNTTTVLNVSTSTDTSQVTNSVVTNSHLVNDTNNTFTTVKSQIAEVNSSENPLFDRITSTENNGFIINETSSKSSVVTNNHLVNDTNNSFTTVASQIAEVSSSEKPLFDRITSTENYEFKTNEPNSILRIETETVHYANERSTTVRINTDKTTENDYDITFDDDEDDDFYNSDAFVLFFNKETTVTANDQSLSTVSTNTDFTKNEKKEMMYTQNLLETKDNETRTDKVVDVATTGKKYILEKLSTEFSVTEKMTKNNSVSENSDQNEYAPSSIISFDTTEHVPVEKTEILSSIVTTTDENIAYESSTNNNGQGEWTRNLNDSNSSFQTTVRNNLIHLGVTNLPNEIRIFDTRDMEKSKTETIEFRATEETDTSMILPLETSKVEESEDIDESTSIVPSTEQVVVY